MSNICLYQVIFGLFITHAFGWTCIKPVQGVFCRESQRCTIHFNIAAYLSTSIVSLAYYDDKFFGSVLYSGGQAYVNPALGTNLTADTAGNIWLTLTSVQRSGAGTYVVQLLQSNWPCVTMFILSVPTTPSISKNKDPSVGESVTLTCSGASTTIPSNHSLNLVYNWSVDAVDDPSSSRYTYSASRHTLTMSSVVKDDASKRFTCTSTEDVTEGYTSARSTAVSVSVLYGPDGACENVSSVQTFTEGDSTASISCFSECYPGCSYTWSNGSGMLSNSEILSLGSVRRYQAGNYTFSVRNTAQTYSKSAQKIFTIVVKYAPVVSIEFSTIDHSEGTSLTLFCRGEGVPPNYTYTGLTQAVGGVQIPNTALEHTETYSSIHFPNLQLQDTGNYTCKINNGIRDLTGILDQTRTVQLLVNVQPKILEDDLTYSGAQTNPVTVQVPFYCYPDVQSVTFVRYDGTVIQNSTKYMTAIMPGKVNETFYGKEVTLNGYIAVLTINDLQEEDFVNYTLTVRNNRGTTSELIFIVLESIASIPRAFFLSSAGLFFIWEKNFNGGLQQTFIIQVSADGTEEWHDLSRVDEKDSSYQVSGTFYMIKIKDLIPGTYTARLIAANPLGETPPLYLNSTFTILSVENAKDESDAVSTSTLAGGILGGFVAGVFVSTSVFVFITMKRKGLQCKDKGNSTDESSSPQYESLGSPEQVNAAATYSSLTPAKQKDEQIKQHGSSDGDRAYANIKLRAI